MPAVGSTASSFLALPALEIHKSGWVWILGVTAVIYNPIVRVHLTREIWSVVNIATIAMLAVTFAVFGNRSLPEEKGDHTDER